ncbi:MAG TPA: hypothetical protein VMQ44_02045 [Candidatus Saccharimonadales bacterium]|nr:hypothetical protein [Candidatus Saccharimonadales bacterium]
MAHEEILITSDEADEVVQVSSGGASALRNPVLIIVGVVMVVAFTLLVMIILSLKGVKTGLGALPGFGSTSGTTLQIPNQ